MWIDDLPKTSQKKMLGNAYIYYVDFLAFKFFLHDSETRKLSLYFPMGKYNFERHISVF